MIRFVGTGKRPRAAPGGDVWTDGDADTLAVELDALPEAASLPPGTRLLVLPDPARGPGILSAFGRRSIARSVRCEALLLNGYVDIGAEEDKPSRLDIVLGRVPPRPG
jgi:hypothetical protein